MAIIFLRQKRKKKKNEEREPKTITSLRIYCFALIILLFLQVVVSCLGFFIFRLRGQEYASHIFLGALDFGLIIMYKTYVLYNLTFTYDDTGYFPRRKDIFRYWLRPKKANSDLFRRASLLEVGFTGNVSLPDQYLAEEKGLAPLHPWERSLILSKIKAESNWRQDAWRESVIKVTGEDPFGAGY